MAAKKLTKIEQDHILAWLIEGLTSQVIIDKCFTMFNKKISKQAINYYLDKHYDEVIAGQEEGLRRIKTKGICVVENRIQLLQKNIDKIQRNLDSIEEWDRDSTRQAQDLIKIMTFLQNQLGELTGQQITANGCSTITIQIPSFTQEDVINDN